MTHPDDLLLATGCTPMAIAVSGGSDSMALLTLAAQARADKPEALLALTVDHGLRAGAHAEALAVAGHCSERGIAHRILAWREHRPKTGVMAAARLARYHLLADATRQAGGHAVLTGHTLDDQIETLAMRAARGDGPGMAGIAPATLFAGRVWFMRPLLGRRREDLRCLLRARKIVWADDPSNDDRRFERVRWRNILMQWTDRDIRDLLDRAEAEAGRRQALARAAAAFIADHTLFDTGDWPHGLALRIGTDAGAETVAEAALQASRLLGARGHGPGVEARNRIAAVMSGARGRAFTAGGAVFRRAGDHLTVTRDPRAQGADPGLPQIIPCFDLPVFAALASRIGLDALPPLPGRPGGAGGL